MTFKKYDKNN